MSTRQILFAEEVRGQPGAWLVTLDCGHKLATRQQLVEYECRECPAADTCIICNQQVTPGTGGVAIGPFPALHVACAKRANEEAAGGPLNDEDLREATAELIAARVALGRAVNNRSPEVAIAAVGLLVCDLMEHVVAHKELAEDGLLDQIRHLGETIVEAATTKGGTAQA